MVAFPPVTAPPSTPLADPQSSAFAAWGGFYRGLLLPRRAHAPAVIDRLRRVRTYLEAHPDEQLDLAGMARTACFSKFHFLRLFRQAYGETPLRYLAQLRLERARTLLETSDLSVTEICFEVGYESLPSFSAAFRRYAGAPPQSYRRRWLAVPRAPLPSLRVPGCFVAMYS
jgi:transcriptional regulator GlxA family with amidase domain